MARSLAETYADGSLCLAQEGGYQLSTVAFDTAAVLAGALRHESDELASEETMWPNENTALAQERLDDAAAAYGEFWDLPAD
jgi:acetoin utilization deacetylase AcuC-like enzyme